MKRKISDIKVPSRYRNLDSIVGKSIVSMNPRDLIDHPLNTELFDDVNEYETIKEDIRRRGIQDPLQIVKIEEGYMIVSGHERKKMAIELGIEVPCIIRDDLDEDWQREEQVISDNLLRRHLTDYQKVASSLKLESIHKIKAKERQKVSKGRGNKGQSNLTEDKGNARDIIAKKVGLSSGQLYKAKKVFNDAPEPMKKLWKDNKVTTHKAYTHTVRKERLEEVERHKIDRPIPDGEYSVILADPPWNDDFGATDSRATGRHYPTMELEEIKRLKVPSADDAVLFLWSTAPMLKKALEVMEAWGFSYRTSAVWDKDEMGHGKYFRVQHEYLLLGKKGKFRAPSPKDLTRSVIRKRRTKHSVKPKIVYDIIEKMYPGQKYLELFARNERKGWTSWGNELPGIERVL